MKHFCHDLIYDTKTALFHPIENSSLYDLFYIYKFSFQKKLQLMLFALPELSNLIHA